MNKSISIILDVLVENTEFTVDLDPPTKWYTEFPNSHPCNSIARKLNHAHCSLTLVIARKPVHPSICCISYFATFDLIEIFLFFFFFLNLYSYLHLNILLLIRLLEIKHTILDFSINIANHFIYRVSKDISSQVKPVLIKLKWKNFSKSFFQTQAYLHFLALHISLSFFISFSYIYISIINNFI